MKRCRRGCGWNRASGGKAGRPRLDPAAMLEAFMVAKQRHRMPVRMLPAEAADPHRRWQDGSVAVKRPARSASVISGDTAQGPRHSIPSRPPRCRDSWLAWRMRVSASCSCRPSLDCCFKPVTLMAPIALPVRSRMQVPMHNDTFGIFLVINGVAAGDGAVEIVIDRRQSEVRVWASAAACRLPSGSRCSARAALPPAWTCQPPSNAAVHAAQRRVETDGARRIGHGRSPRHNLHQGWPRG